MSAIFLHVRVVNDVLWSKNIYNDSIRRRADIVEKKQTAEKLEKVIAQINKLKLNLRRLKML